MKCLLYLYAGCLCIHCLNFKSTFIHTCRNDNLNENTISKHIHHIKRGYVPQTCKIQPYVQNGNIAVARYTCVQTLNYVSAKEETKRKRGDLLLVWKTQRPLFSSPPIDRFLLGTLDRCVWFSFGSMLILIYQFSMF